MKVLAEEPFNSFIHWSWSNWASISLALAQSLYETVENGTVMPDFTETGDQALTFHLPEEIIEDFHSSFWDQEMEKYDASGNTSRVSVRMFAEEWLNEAIKDRPGNHRIGDLLDLFKEKNISTKALSRFFDGDRWEIWTGAKETEMPFTLGVRLSEPDFAAGDEVDQWKLEPFLRGKRNEEHFFLWSDRSKVPFAWKKYLDQAEAEMDRWKDLFPWMDEIITEDHEANH